MRFTALDSTRKAGAEGSARAAEQVWAKAQVLSRATVIPRLPALLC
jgi:hypothetical protein